MRFTLLFPLLLAGAAAAQEEKEKPNPSAGGVNEVRVTQAIERGIKFLRTAASPDLHGAYGNSDELLLWTFMHAGVPEDDPKFQELFKSVTTQEFKRTYKVALLAMILEELDAVKYQEKIAQCAQHLVDNQGPNGQWGYGQKVESVKAVAVPEPSKPAVASGIKPAPGAKVKKPALKKITIKKTQDGVDPGDNSNSQYAALGLRSCHDAGIVIPDATVSAAVKWWKESQFDEANRNKAAAGGKPAVASGGPTKAAEGWNYKTAATDERPAFHTMTAGAAGALVIYAYMQKKDWKKDPNVASAMNWLVQKWEMPAWNGYYLYALERFGILYGTEQIGSHFWYREGAYALLGIQKPDGSWGEDTEGVNGGTWYGKTWDTCFSILFLRRATRPLVASGVSK